ncbi:DoxX family protein [Flavobacteriaceae bacterium TP-CH-4]|uniref:DoxX family protein n=1 Tax=Pelagihabitans pacificus TaxID=2696054 RepID=A0A967AU76_9FLAO|nr:DoxX family protein [Pelagihabitans pacificus]NHF60479.1 DoxX family protein [Pelagihabitans pacificus]
MEYIIIAAKVIIFISIINVWFFRFNKPTEWRGGSANSMKEEFKTYGLSETMMYLVGGLKVLSAVLLLVSIWMPSLALYGAATMAVLMLGAIGMHLKISDPIKRSLPAFIFLVLSLLILAGHYGYL